MARNYRIEYIESASGRCPIEQFIDRLDADTRAKIDMHLDLLEEFGLELGGAYLRKINKKPDIWELRVISKSRWYRLLFVTKPNRRIVILHIYQKKSNRTPMRELKVAIRNAALV